MCENKMILEAKAAKKGFHWGLELLLFAAVFLAAEIVASIPLIVAETVLAMTTFRESGSLTVSEMLGNQPVWMTPLQLFSTGLMTVTVLLFCKLLQKRSVRSVGLGAKHALPEYLVGALIGILMISASFGVCLAFGGFRAVRSDFSIGIWIACLFGFLIQGMSEEVLCRGYFMVSVARKNALFWAVFLNSIFFSLLHLLNPGFSLLACLNIFLFGLFESFFVLWRGNLWGACAIHSFWNFFQGNVFGVSVSGSEIVASPLLAQNVDGQAKQLWNGGAFGLEGGLAVTLVLLVATTAVLLLWLRSRKRDQKEPVRVNVDDAPLSYDPFGK